jgi:hypothetical protein
MTTCCFKRKLTPQGPFNVETEKARLAPGPFTAADWLSIEKKNKWVKSGVVDRMVSHFNLMGNKTVLVTNIALEHALFPNPNEATDLKAFLERNHPAKMGGLWHQRWTRDLEHLLMLVMLVNTGNTHWCLLVTPIGACLWSIFSLKSAGGDWYAQVDRDRLRAFVKAFNPETSDLHELIAEVLQQKSKTNCGVFMLEFIWPL